MKPVERFAANLKALRKNAGMSQEQVADLIFVQRTSYSGYERGKTEASFECLIRISNLFKVNLDTLLRRDITFTDDRHEVRMEGTRILVSAELH